MAFPTVNQPVPDLTGVPFGRPLAWHLAILCLALLVPILFLGAILTWTYTESEQNRLEEETLRMAHDVTAATDPQVDRAMLLLIAQQFSLRIPDLKAAAVDYVMIGTQRLGCFERQFERLKRLHGMAVMGGDAKRIV
jgi:hypothetical protein